MDVESRALASGLVSNVTGGSNRHPTTGAPTPPILPDNNNNNERPSSSSSWQVGGGDAHLAPLLPLQLAPCPTIVAAPSGEARIIDDNTKVDQQAVVQQPQPKLSSSSGPQQPTLSAINNSHSEDHQTKSYSEWINCTGNNNNGSEGWTQFIPPPAIIFEGRKLPVLPVRPGRINVASSTGTGTTIMMMPVESHQYKNGNSHGGAKAKTVTATTSGSQVVKIVRTSTRVSQRKSRLATKAAEGGVGSGNKDRARNAQLFRLLELQERLTHSSSSHQLSGNDDDADDDDDDMVVDDDGYYYYDKVGLPVTSRKAVVKGDEVAFMDMMMVDEMIHINDVGTCTGKRHKSNGYNGHAVPTSVTPPPPNRQNGGSLYASSCGDFSNGSNSALDALAGAAAAALEQGCSDDGYY